MGATMQVERQRHQNRIAAPQRIRVNSAKSAVETLLDRIEFAARIPETVSTAETLRKVLESPRTSASVLREFDEQARLAEVNLKRCMQCKDPEPDRDTTQTTKQTWELLEVLSDDTQTRLRKPTGILTTKPKERSLKVQCFERTCEAGKKSR